jgi:hypothetical protein
MCDIGEYFEHLLITIAVSLFWRKVDKIDEFFWVFGEMFKLELKGGGRRKACQLQNVAGIPRGHG